MIFQSPGPILLEVGPLTIRWYGFLIAMSFLACYLIASNIIEKKYPNISQDDLSDFSVVTIISGLIGARSWFVLLNLDYYLAHPSESFQIWLGGQSIQGAIVGAVLGTFLFECVYASAKRGKRKKEKEWTSFLEKLSLIAVVLPLGQAIGRWGNFFNEEAFGSMTDLPWKLYISQTGTYHHPTFLYESIYNLIVFFIMMKIFQKLKPLEIIASYLGLYSIGRLAIESIRTDSLYIGDIKAATLVSVMMLLASVVLLVISKKQKL